MSVSDPSQRLCETCQTPFVPQHRSDQKYCTYDCGKTAWDRKQAALKVTTYTTCNCLYCFNEFVLSSAKSGKKQIFCSFYCKDEYHKQQKRIKNKERNESNPKECSFCKKMYVPYREDQQYCSRKCKTDEHAQNQRDQRASVRAATVRECPICEKEFSPNYTMKEKYCSPKCRTLINKKIYKMMQSTYDKCGTDKADHSHEVLGYSPNELLAHLQTFAQWDELKLGSWHLDHIFPIAAFVRRGITDARIICRLDNLQPLVGEDNCSKGDDCDEVAFDEWLKLVGVIL